MRKYFTYLLFLVLTLILPIVNADHGCLFGNEIKVEGDICTQCNSSVIISLENTNVKFIQLESNINVYFDKKTGQIKPTENIRKSLSEPLEIYQPAFSIPYNQGFHYWVTIPNSVNLHAITLRVVTYEDFLEKCKGKSDLSQIKEDKPNITGNKYPLSSSSIPNQSKANFTGQGPENAGIFGKILYNLPFILLLLGPLTFILGVIYYTIKGKPILNSLKEAWKHKYGVKEPKTKKK